MNIEQLTIFFGWTSLLNYLLLTFWFLIFCVARDWLFELHNAWFDISREQFNLMNYNGMAYYKIFLFIFNLMPYLTLQFII